MPWRFLFTNEVFGLLSQTVHVWVNWRNGLASNKMKVNTLKQNRNSIWQWLLWYSENLYCSQNKPTHLISVKSKTNMIFPKGRYFYSEKTMRMKGWCIWSETKIILLAPFSTLIKITYSWTTIPPTPFFQIILGKHLELQQQQHL